MTGTAEHLSLEDVSIRAGRILDEVERAVVGKRPALELALCALLADGHVLIEDYPGLAKTLIARSFATVIGTAVLAGAVHARPDAIGRHRRIDLQPAHRRVRVPPGAGVHQRPARGRDQPRSPEDPGRAAGGDAGAAGHHRRPHAHRSSGRSSCWPPRTRSSTRAPIRCPEAQLDRFLIRMRVGYPSADDEWEMLERRLERREDEPELRAGRRSR